jgi:ubiquinone/menaquinone biosynthesis C-methylase UbiE
MSDDTHQQVQERFGAFAERYVNSAVHKSGYSLDRLIELVNPQQGQRALDVATGGGHVALGLARAGASVIASDLTVPMLHAARSYIQGEGVTATFARVDAQHLPFADNSLDLVTCRIAPHHFPDVADFVQECARVVRPGGIVGIVDQIAPPKRQAAEYINTFERLHDPSHVWEYSQKEWERFFSRAKLEIRHRELARNRLDFAWWTQMQNNDAETVMRLRILLAQAPQAVIDWLEPDLSGNGSFSLWQLILIGVKG